MMDNGVSSRRGKKYAVVETSLREVQDLLDISAVLGLVGVVVLVRGRPVQALVLGVSHRQASTTRLCI